LRVASSGDFVAQAKGVAGDRLPGVLAWVKLPLVTDHWSPATGHRQPDMQMNYHELTDELVRTLTADPREQALRLGPASAARALLALYERECDGDPRAIAAVRIAQ
jgi:hypothetical protein